MFVLLIEPKALFSSDRGIWNISVIPNGLMGAFHLAFRAKNEGVVFVSDQEISLGRRPHPSG